MFSLYRRAESLRREDKLIRLIRREIPPAEDHFNISAREEEEILDHLDDVVVRKKINVNNGTFSFRSRKSDYLFPVIVNMIIFTAVVAAIFFVANYSRSREESIISEAGELLSTEGKLIAKLKEETEKQLQKKDAEIAVTMQKLRDINEEHNLLQLEMEKRIRTREIELKENLDSILEAERIKLQKEGISTTEIESKLRVLENEKDLEYEQLLSEFTSKAKSEIQQKENALLEMKNEYEALLQQKQSEQLTIEQTQKEREAELLSQLHSRTQESEAEKSEISRQLDILTTQRREEQLVQQQIQGFYKQINADIDASDYDKALLKLSAFEKFITTEPTASLPVIADKIGVELFIIDSIEQLINQKRSGELETTVVIADDSRKISEVSTIVEEADALFNEGDIDGASILYLDALNRIPVLSRSYDRLKVISDQNYLEKIAAADQIIAKLNEMVREYRLSAADRRALGERISAARILFDNDAKLSGTESELSQEELLSLLQAKLLMKQILNSESVKSEYPDLYENVEKYFVTFGEEMKMEGKYATMRDVIAFISILSNPDSNLSDELPTSAGGTKLEKALYGELLEKLNKLIEKTG